MVLSYATKCPVIQQVITGTMAAGICETQSLGINYATAATILQVKTEITDLGFAASNTKISHYRRTKQEQFLSRPVKTKHDSAPRQQDSQLGIFDKKPRCHRIEKH